jgi:hypothetical protein
VKEEEEDQVVLLSFVPHQRLDRKESHRRDPIIYKALEKTLLAFRVPGSKTTTAKTLDGLNSSTFQKFFFFYIFI